MTRSGTAMYVPPGQLAVSQSRLDPGITSIADLAAVVTIGLTLPCIKEWIDANTGVFQVWYGAYSLADTDGVSIQRANDWTATHPFVWFRTSS